MFKSTNGGGNWSAVNTGLTTTYVLALAIDPTTPTTLYAGKHVSGGGVFKSTNGGGNWNAVNTGLGSRAVKALAIDPQTPATLYAGVSAGNATGAVYRSTNGGGTWVDTGLTDTFVRAAMSLAIDPTSPSTLYAGTYDGVFGIQQIPATLTPILHRDTAPDANRDANEHRHSDRYGKPIQSLSALDLSVLRAASYPRGRQPDRPVPNWLRPEYTAGCVRDEVKRSCSP